MHIVLRTYMYEVCRGGGGGGYDVISICITQVGNTNTFHIYLVSLLSRFLFVYKERGFIVSDDRM